MARMAVFDRCSRRQLDYVNENGLPSSVIDVEFVNTVVNDAGAYFDDEGCLRVPGET